MDFIVYILYCENKNKYYLGYTSNVEKVIKRPNRKRKY